MRARRNRLAEPREVPANTTDLPTRDVSGVRSSNV